MAKQEIYLGVEGNDGTGDSIREAFRKTNENVTELYAVFGQGGTITFQALSDTPDAITPNGIVLGNSTGTAMVQKTLNAGTGITIDNTSDTAIVITNTGANINADTTPIFGGPVSGNRVYPIGLINTSAAAISEFNTTHGETITIDDLVLDKKYIDANYAPNIITQTTKSVLARNEPANATEYTKTITEYRNGGAVITGHGLDFSTNGAPFKFLSTDTPPTGLTNNTTYYVRVVDTNNITLHDSVSEAQNNDDTSRVKVNINLGTTVTPAGTDTLIDGEYNSDLYGFYKENEALPRKNAVRRSGDNLTGALYLADHPGDLAGTVTGVEEDKQAATKLYVDNTSYASTEDLFVTKQGDDTQAKTPIGLEGRGQSYAYGSLKAALLKAEEVIESAPVEPGAYTQVITYDSGRSRAVISANATTSPYAAASNAITYMKENKVFIQKAVVDHVKDTFPTHSFAASSVVNPKAEALIIKNKKFIQEETVQWINNQVATHTNAGSGIFDGFTFDATKCKRDTGLIVDAWVNDLGKGGNLETVRHAKSYWAGVVVNVPGQVAQTNAAIEFARDLTKNYVLTNTQYSTLQRTYPVLSSNLATNTFEVFVGKHSLAHTYVSGGFVIKPDETEIAITGFVYNNVTGVATVTASSHNQSSGALIKLRDILVSCASGQKTYPYPHVPQTNTDTFIVDSYGLGGTQFRTYIGPSTYAHTYVSGGKVMKADYTFLTITNAVYDNTTGWLTVTTAANGLSAGNIVRLEGIVFNCSQGQLSYPELLRAEHQSAFDALASGLTTNSFQVQVGPNQYVHTWVSGGTATKPDSTVLTITDFTYDNKTGITTVTTSTAHGITEGMPITLANITVTCSQGTKVYPETAENLGTRANTLTAIITNVISNGLTAVPAPVGPKKSNNTCERDIGLIVDGMVIDLANGVNSNFHAIQSAVRYFSTPSGAKARIAQKSQTLSAIAKAKAIVNAVVSNTDLETASKTFVVNANNLSANSFEITLATSTLLHTYISGGSVTKSGVKINITGFNYNNTTGITTVTTSTAHGYSASDQVIIENVLLECANGQKLYPSDYTSLVPQFRSTALNNVSQTVKNSIIAKFDIITNILTNGLSVRPTLVEGSTYTLDFTNGGNGNTDQGVNNNVDILPGKLIKGRTSGALGRIVKYTSGADLSGATSDRVEVVLVEPKEFRLGEELEYGNQTAEKQITVHVETGIYYEDYPLKVPANVSVKGSDFRRCQIRPANRISQSPWANTYFFRDKLLDNLKITDYTGSDLATAQAITLTGDNSAGGIVTITPADNVAPTSWDGKWFYTDAGAVGLISNADGGSSFDVTMTIDILANLSSIASGDWHIKNTVNYGYHYLTDPTDSTSIAKNNIDMDVFLMNDATRLANMSFQGHGGFAQVLDPAGQILVKSPYTQVCGSFSRSTNKQGFKGGMYIDGFAGNLETKITGKTDNYTLQVESDAGTGLRLRKPQTPAPFFIAGVRYQVDAVSEYDGSAGTAKLLINKLSNEGNGYVGTTFPQSIFVQTAGNRSMLANDYTQVNDLGYGLFCNNAALSEQVSTFTYYNHTAFFSNNGSEIRALNCSNANGNFGLVAAGSDPNETLDAVTSLRNMQQPIKVYDDGGTYDHPVGATSVYVYDYDYAPYNNSLLDVVSATGVTTYEVKSASIAAAAPTQTGVKGSGQAVYRLALGGTSGLEAVLANGDILTLRMNKNHLFSGVNAETSTRPSTALLFAENPNGVYRTISFNNQDSDLSSLASDRFQIVFDSGFEHLSLTLDNTYASDATYAGSGGTKMGDTAGDDVLAITRLTSPQQSRLANNDMIFVHAGRTHVVQNYVERVDASNSDYEYATVELTQLAGQDISGAGGTGLVSSIKFGGGSPGTRTIGLSLQDAEAATITVGISTLRANGHDFDKIGTGGFNTTNYPSIIYGAPTISATQAQEVQERGKGRVFFASTDQDGFFRIGRFFSVDQGTGTVSFAASIAISNLDGLGFTRGVTIAEFSNDDGLSDKAPDTVPTEFAVEKFVERRMHFSRTNSLVSAGQQIGAGALARDGTTDMTGDLDAGGYHIVNLAVPSAGENNYATPKSYVDARTPFSTSFMVGGSGALARTTGDIPIWNGTAWDTATPTGAITLTWNSVSQGVNFAIASGAVINGSVDANAAIAQSKLNMNSATTRANATGIAQSDLGLSAFDSGDFTVTDGWVTLKAGSVDFADLPSIAQNTVFGRTVANAGVPSAVTFADVVNTGGSFTDTGVASRIVKTGSDGRIDAQALYIDNFKIIDQLANTLTFTTPGGANLIQSVGTIPSNTTNTMAGSLLIQNTSAPVSNTVNKSVFLQNRTLGSTTDATLNSSVLATNWMYSSFIEAPGERTASSTGISIGAGTGFTSAGQVAIVANDNSPSVIFAQTEMTPNTDGGYNIGSTTKGFGDIYANTFSGVSTSAKYADLAENYLGDQDYEAGTVLVFGGDQEVTTTEHKGDRKVAGVVSTNPAHLMNTGLEGDHIIALGLSGRVPCKVIGKVDKGDMLVTSAIAGFAIVDNNPVIGTVIGKAVTSKEDAGEGTIEVVVGRV